MTSKQLATDILELVGTQENINSVTHCATRLRFKLKDGHQVKMDELKEHPGVVNVMLVSGQYQVIVGNRVANVYHDLIELANINPGEADHDVDLTAKSGEKQKFMDKAIETISSIFTPLVGGLAGTGIMIGFLNIAVVMGWLDETQGTYQIFNAVANGFLTFIPMALAVTAARRFKANEFIAMGLAAALLFPEIMEFTMENNLEFFGIPIVFISGLGYYSTVIPIIIAVYVQSFVEKFFRKHIPAIFSVFAVAMFTLLIMAPLTFVAIGPIGLIIANLLGSAFEWLFNFNAIIAGLILGGSWQFAVVFGLHWGVVPLIINNLGANGFDAIGPLIAPSIMAQAGASLAVYFKAKDIKLKGLAASGAITAIFGITEPTVYGVTLPLKKPFIAASIGGAVGGAVNAMFNVVTFGFGGANILGFGNYVHPVYGLGANFFEAVAAAAIGFVVAFFVTLVIGINNHKKAADAKQTDEVKKITPATKPAEAEQIVSPLTGAIVKLENTPDPAFAAGALGKGIAIEPTVGKLFAPATGKITALFPTGHAVGLTTNTGIEILMHIGMDTVELNGAGFTAKVKQGASVKQGDLLVEFDIEAIKKAGLLVVTPIVITNSANFTTIEAENCETIDVGAPLLTIIKS